jgi:hypothetical protein
MAAAIPYIMVATAVAGTAVSVYSAAKAGEAQKEASQREASRSRLAAQQKAEDTRKLHLRVMAAQKARYGASGLTMEGSPLLVQMESMKESEDELRRIIEAGEYGADITERTGSQAATSGYVKAFGSAVGGVGTIDRVGRNYDWWGAE